VVVLKIVVLRRFQYLLVIIRGGNRGVLLSHAAERRGEAAGFAQSVASGSSVMLVCRIHGISSGQLYTWGRQFRMGELTGFAPVRVASPVGQLAPASPVVDPALPNPEADRAADGMIEVALPSGVKLRITGAVDEAALRRVLLALS
jgi:transposase